MTILPAPATYMARGGNAADYASGRATDQSGDAAGLRITSPATTIVSTTSSFIHVTGTASDNVAMSAVKWSTSNGDTGVASGLTAWSADIPILVGTTTVTVRAYDVAGNSG